MPEARLGRMSPGAVADAGPFIHLAEIGAEDAFRIFARVLVPEPVARELRTRPGGPGAALLARAPSRVIDLSATENQACEQHSLRYEVSLVDASVLAVARARNFGIVATDDLQLRDAAKQMGLQPVGTIGILLRAASRGIVKRAAAEGALDAILTRSSLFVTRELVEEARSALRRMRR